MGDDNFDSVDNESSIVGESGNYSKKSGFDKGAVVQKQVERCLIARAKDLSKPGYTTWIKDKDGTIKPQEIPDYRKEFIGAIRGLKCILTPEILKDKETLDLVKTFNTKSKDLFDKYAYKEVTGKKWDSKNSKGVWIYSGKVYMPELGAILPMNKPNEPDSVEYLKLPNVWDNYHNAYYTELIELHDKLFEDLNVLIDINDYFKTGSEW